MGHVQEGRGADVGAAIDCVLERAATSGGARSALLVVARSDAPPEWFAAHLTDTDAAALAALVLGDETRPAHVLVADVPHHVGPGSARAVLVVVHVAGTTPGPDETALVQALAEQARAALDLRAVVEACAREAERVEGLARLAHDLSSLTRPSDVADRVVRSLREVTGCRAGSVLHLDRPGGVLTVMASDGHTPEQRRLLHGATLRARDVPELTAMITRREPVVLHVESASAPIAAILEGTGSATVIAVPLVADDQLLGVLSAGWAAPDALGDGEEVVLRNLTAVADLASTVWHNTQLRAAVRHQSSHDGLTGLANRETFRHRLDDALRDAYAESGTAVLTCDLDKFTGVNQVYGHRAGDELLRQVAARLGGELRVQDMVGRLGGDEFGVLLVDVDEHRAVAVAHRVVDSLDAPFRIEGREVRITVSIGVAVHEGQAGRGERVLASADHAMRAAKERGRNQIVVAGDDESGAGVPSLEAELAHAAELNQLRLYFQPLVDATGAENGIVGAEALLRWAHPRLGLLAPAAFLPLAEESGLITELDLWAVDAACAALAALDPAGLPLRMAVNMASATLLDPRLLPTVRTALAARGLDPARLHVEVVESRALADLPAVVDSMRELRQLGVRISLDDFGTGYSTLSWLHSLPVDQIKIDRSFVMRLPSDAASVAVVRGVLALARELDIEVVAEGVEDAEQLASLREAGCDLVQGYLLGRPGPLLAPRTAAHAPEASGTPRR